MRNTLIAACLVVALALFALLAMAEPNKTFSIDSWTIAAEQGDAEARYLLGKHYWDGYVKRLFPYPSEESSPRVSGLEALKAEFWFRLAAEQGHAEAAQSLGRIYIYGWAGLPQIDYHEAVKWMRRGAEKGHPPSQMDLGSMYENGQGVPQDYLLAHMWYNLAAAGYPADEVSRVADVPCCRAAVIKLRDALSTKMTPDQIAEAQRMAREWLEQHQAKRQQ